MAWFLASPTRRARASQPTTASKREPSREASSRRNREGAPDRTSGRATPQLDDTYWQRTQRPLQCLVFLLPLLFLYELGVLTYATDYERGVTEHIVARSLLLEFSRWLGLGLPGLYLPGAIIVLALMTWHLLRRDPWRIHPKTLPYMFAEAVALALPMFVFAMVLLRMQSPMVQPTEAQVMAVSPAANMVAMAEPPANGEATAIDRKAATGGASPLLLQQTSVGEAGADPATGASWQAGLVFSVGAGIYEELLFRLLGILLLTALCTEVLALPRDVALTTSILVAAMLFGLYHFKSLNAFNLGHFLFYTGAGVYLGYVFVLRGFGIVVAAHAMYDVMVVMLKHGG